MKAEILAVGTEILLGDIVNTNAQFLARELAELGIDVYYQTVVGDNPRRLRDTIFNAFSRADLIITSGGLGPTEDDLTKETGAEYFGREMIFDERALEDVQRVFRAAGRKMTDNNLKQAYVPEGAIPLYNENGTAPGIIIEDKGKIMVMLPGPPKELKPMFKKQVRPFLAERQEHTLVSRVLRVAGIGESVMEEMVKDIIDAQANPTIAPYAKYVECLLRVTARGESREAAEALIEPVAKRIYERLGDAVYAEGEDVTMQSVVAEELLRRDMTIALAESCTGGLLAAALVEYPGISRAFIDGVVCYSNEAKMKRLGVKPETLEKYGAVSGETAAEMAAGAAKTSGARIGLSTTGIAGPAGGTDGKPVGLVYIGVCIDGKSTTKEMHFSGDRTRIRERAVYSALNLLRRELKRV